MICEDTLDVILEFVSFKVGSILVRISEDEVSGKSIITALLTVSCGGKWNHTSLLEVEEETLFARKQDLFEDIKAVDNLDQIDYVEVLGQFVLTLVKETMLQFLVLFLDAALGDASE